MNRVLYREWFPQILYNHHQSGPAGTVLYSPPLRDPFNYNQDPLVVLGIQTIGNALHTRLAAEGKPGATMRSGGPYDGWWNGGIRNTAAFHNTIAILTEMIGSPTPMRIPLVHGSPAADERPRVSDRAAGMALPPVDRLLGLAATARFSTSRRDEGELPLQPLRDGQALDRARQHGHVDAAAASVRGDRRPRSLGGAGGAAPAAGAARRAGAAARRRRQRRPRCGPRCTSRTIAIRARYIIPSSQPDFPTATQVHQRAARDRHHRAARDARVHRRRARRYPAGSYVVLDRAGVPAARDGHVRAAGSSGQLPVSGRAADAAVRQRRLDARVSDGRRVRSRFSTGSPGRSRRSPIGTSSRRPGRVHRRREPAAYVDVARADSTRSSPRTGCLPAGEDGVARRRRPFRRDAATHDAVADRPEGRGRARRELHDRDARRAAAGRASSRSRASASGISTAARWTPGWTRWILEQFEFPFERVFAPELDAGNLNAKYDALIFVGGAIPGCRRRPWWPRRRRRGRRAERGPPNIPAEYRDQIGSVTVDRTLPQLQQFIENGGTVIAIGTSATNLARVPRSCRSRTISSRTARRCRRRSSTRRARCCARTSTRRSPVAAGMTEPTPTCSSTTVRSGSSARTRRRAA